MYTINVYVQASPHHRNFPRYADIRKVSFANVQCQIEIFAPILSAMLKTEPNTRKTTHKYYIENCIPFSQLHHSAQHPKRDPSPSTRETHSCTRTRYMVQKGEMFLSP